MTINVEDGTEIVDANSYISVTDCGTFLNDLGYADWDILDTATKESSLLRANQYIETKYKLRFKGKTKTITQSLSFPRIQLIDENGRVVSSTTIPQELKDAQCILANLAVDIDTGDLIQLTTVTTKEDVIKVKKVKVDTIEKETEYFQSVTQKFYREVEDLLAPLISISGSWTLSRG